MRTICLFLFLFTTQCFAGFTVDLTDPQYLSIANMYPSYETMDSINFDDSENNISLIGLKSDKKSDTWDAVFAATIGVSKGGEQRIYIDLAKTCSEKEHKLVNATIKTNEQSVRYTRYCDGTNIYLTPTSKAGDRFLINEFKSKDTVKFEFSNIVLLFDATGFTRAWNNFNGDAL